MISLSIRVYSHRSLGGGLHCTVIGGLITKSQPDFGSAIEEICIELYRRAPSQIGLPVGDERLWSVALSKLPRRKYEKSKRRYTIQALSDLPGEEPLDQSIEELRANALQARVRYLNPPNMFDQLSAEFDDVASAMEHSPPKLKAAEFDWTAFVAWFRGRRGDLPKSELALQVAINAAVAAENERVAALDPWDRQEVNWNDFHPEARQLLADPWFWDSSDDFAPNGNDVGADVLHALLRWHRRNRSKAFELPALERLAKRFSCDLHQPWAQMDSFDLDHKADFLVGVAFAHIKLRGDCPKWLAKFAHAAWDAVVADIELSHPGWKGKKEKLASIARLRAMLDKLEN